MPLSPELEARLKDCIWAFPRQWSKFQETEANYLCAPLENGYNPVCELIKENPPQNDFTMLFLLPNFLNQESMVDRHRREAEEILRGEVKLYSEEEIFAELFGSTPLV